jgi:uncharacterized membrane protein YccC
MWTRVEISAYRDAALKDAMIEPNLSRQQGRPRVGRQWSDLIRVIGDIASDLKTLLRPGTRLVDQAEAIASVLLAILIAKLAGTHNIGWAAFSSFLVIRSHISASMQRATFRVLGTICGAIAGYFVATHIEKHMEWVCLTLLLVVTGTMYMALVSCRMYAWLLTGLTFLMVVVESTTPQAASPASFARSRVTEILIGTSASLIVSYVSSKVVRPWIPGQPPKAALSHRGWHRKASLHALKAGISAALIPILADWLATPALIQAGVTVMAVMVIPLSSVDQNTNAVSRRMVHRFIGCSLGAFLAITILLTCRHDPVLMTFGLCIGVAIGRHIENGANRYAYIGVQFALAFLVILVPDDYSLVSIKPGMERLLGIITGFTLLATTMLIFQGIQLLWSRYTSVRTGG